MHSPAIKNPALVYPHLLRKPYNGVNPPNFLTTSALVKADVQYIKSPWNVSIPMRWQRMSVKFSSLATHESFMLKSGSHFTTLSFREHFLSYCSQESNVAVKALVFEPIIN